MECQRISIYIVFGVAIFYLSASQVRGEEETCLKVDAECTEHAQCCDKKCKFEKCLAGCKPSGATCNLEKDCCSKNCDVGHCRDCKPEGQTCFLASDCCSSNCAHSPKGNKCGPKINSVPGEKPIESTGTQEPKPTTGQEKSNAISINMNNVNIPLLILLICVLQTRLYLL